RERRHPERLPGHRPPPPRPRPHPARLPRQRPRPASHRRPTRTRRRRDPPIAASSIRGGRVEDGLQRAVPVGRAGEVDLVTSEGRGGLPRSRGRSSRTPSSLTRGGALRVLPAAAWPLLGPRGLARDSPEPAADQRPKRVAGVVTRYDRGLHADVLLGRIL